MHALPIHWNLTAPLKLEGEHTAAEQIGNSERTQVYKKQRVENQRQVIKNACHFDYVMLYHGSHTDQRHRL